MPREATGPLRTCVGCRAVRPQSALLRIARDATGTVTVAPVRWRGRGAYVCGAACLERALARRAVPRALAAEPGAVEPLALRQRLAAVLARPVRVTPSTQRGAAGRVRPGADAAGGL